MKSLWAKIGFGAAGVFLVGMLLITVVREAKSSATAAVRSAVQSGLRQVATAVAPSDLPFRLSGDRVGTIRHLAIRRTARGEVPHADMVVDLADARTLADLARCELVPERAGDLNFEDGFRCAGAPQEKLVEVGRARFEPGGMERPIMVTARSLSDLADGDAFSVDVTPGGETRVEAAGDSGGHVRVLANEHGARIHVSDAMGRALVHLFADSTGAALHIRDEKGREIISMDASDGHFSLNVDTSGVQ